MGCKSLAELGVDTCGRVLSDTGEAEEEGFEPSVPRGGTPVFETGPFNHSGTPPQKIGRLSSRSTSLKKQGE